MIAENVKKVLEELPEGVELVAAAKTRTPEEILQAAEAGVKIVGENYVQEAQRAFALVGQRVKWHFIGHLQRNKVKKAVEIFDMIETLDSLELAEDIDKRCSRIEKIMPVLIEINSGREKQKFGIWPEDAEGLIRDAAKFSNMKIQGLMTMGPAFGNPEDARPYFVETKKLFDKIKALDIAGIEMKCLSMGMTNSYQVAIQEGANMVRIGMKIFGPLEND
ncbi:MAG: YggS family pyridoxal phosphate-dependent enzyme [Candidatus Aminicenantes bacterium]|nr:YggS family pyridoxal phosphate-dependent enzyme [Candidatus Aminicenantes bacterium]MDH5384666.1 YggS family pyridoxal phosphate-dependent enzyme [Candidatus Aminicenantes bacterium]MDH5743040.1 YggS family pyridoxal phosphate-dependent enzyme [Candidatus Aminicenantes bacterium]